MGGEKDEEMEKERKKRRDEWRRSHRAEKETRETEVAGRKVTDSLPCPHGMQLLDVVFCFICGSSSRSSDVNI